MHAVDPLGGRKAKAVQHDLGFVGNVTQTGGHILPVTQGVAEGRIGHGGNDGIRVRIAMTGNINGVHKNLLTK